MTRPKNLNTQYGRTYLNKQNKQPVKQIPLYLTIEEYIQFQKAFNSINSI